LAESSAITGQEASRTISVINSSACSEIGLADDLRYQLQRMLGVQAEPDQRDIGPLSGGHRPDLFHVDLAGDHLVPEPGHDLGKQLEPLPLLVRDQYPQVPDPILSHRHKQM